MLVICSCCFVCDCSLDFSKYMRRRDQVDQHLFDPEPDRTLHRIRREQRIVQIRRCPNVSRTENSTRGGQRIVQNSTQNASQETQQ